MYREINEAFSSRAWRPAHHLWIQTAVSRTDRHWVPVLPASLNELVSGRRCWLNTGALLWQALYCSQVGGHGGTYQTNTSSQQLNACSVCDPFFRQKSCCDLFKIPSYTWRKKAVKMAWLSNYWVKDYIYLSVELLIFPPLFPSPFVFSACTASSVMQPGWRLAGRTWGTSKRRWGVFCTLTPLTWQWETGLMGTQGRPSLLLMVQWRRAKLTPRRRNGIAHLSTGVLKPR